MGSLVAEFKQDLRYGLRLLAKNRSFTIVSVLTLALGIGATSAIFSVLDAVVLSPLPFRDPERLVWVMETDGQGRRRGVAATTLVDWRKASQTIEAVDGIGGITQFTLKGSAGAQRINLEDVGLTTLEALGVQPILGRWHRADDPIVEGDTAETIVISYGLWQTLLGGDPNIIGKTLPGWEAAWGRTVVGVMPPGFWVHPSMADVDGWYAFDYAGIQGARTSPMARLKPGVTWEQAAEELTTIARQTSTEPAGGPQGGPWRVEFEALHDVFTGGYANTLYLLLGAVSFVLLIAAVNVANLQLSRGVTREGEMSTRVALGARRWRLLRQLVTENVVLGLMGGVLGVLVAYLGIWIFVTLAPDFYPPTEEIRVSGTVLIFTLLISLLAGVLSGLVPAFRASRADLQESLKQGARGTVGGGRQRIRRALVVVEVAMALVLLVGAGLMINSYVRVMNVEMGLNPDNVLSMEISLAGLERYRTRHDARHFSVTPAVSTLYTDLIDRMSGLPGVTGVAVTSSLPPRGAPSPPFRVIGGPETGNMSAQYQEISGNYFEVMGIPLLRGRTFTELDSENGPGVAIINETMARQAFQGQDPIGQSIQVSVNRGNPKLQDDRPREIVGIVKDTRPHMRRDPGPAIYIPYQQHLWDYAGSGPFFLHARKDFVIRTAGEPMGAARGVQGAVADVDSAVSIDRMMSMRERLADAAGGERFWVRLLGLFAGLAVFLAAMGIYGVISYSVEQRLHEFGLRVILGARNADILKLVAREGFVLTMAGLIIGIGAAFGLTRFIANRLYGVTPMDPMTIATVALVLVLVSVLACYIPGRRAFRLDPLAVLRPD